MAIPPLDLKISTSQTQAESLTGGDVSGGSSGVVYGDYNAPGSGKSWLWWIVGGVIVLIIGAWLLFRRR